MLEKLKRKWNSQTGASITFALLLFLVCAVLCSVILAASTTASGRMSQLPETDQRYYAVSSATGLLKNQMDGKTVCLVTVTRTAYTTPYTEGVPGTPVKGAETEKTYLIPDKRAGEIGDTDLKDEALIDEAPIDTLVKDAAKRLHTGATSTAPERTLASSRYSTEEFDPLAVTVEETLDADGTVTLRVSNSYNAKGEASAAGDRYTQTLVFGVDRSDTASTRTASEAPVPTGDDAYTVSSVETVTAITELTWRLSGVKHNS